jgi:hypothetical protein
MNGRHSSIVVAISLATSASLASSAAVNAGDLNSPAFTPRQMAHCMMKRARANTAEPYRDAYKACKSQFESALPERAPDTMTAATLPPNPKQ